MHSISSPVTCEPVRCQQSGMLHAVRAQGICDTAIGLARRRGPRGRSATLHFTFFTRKDEKVKVGSARTLRMFTLSEPEIEGTKSDSIVCE